VNRSPMNMCPLTRRRFLRRVALLTGAASLADALPLAASQTQPATTPATPSIPLFNGKDLTGWTPVGTAIWRVEGDALVGTQGDDPKRSGMLLTNESFGDFELDLGVQIDEHGKYNSGVYLRCQRDEKGKLRTGYQVNVGRGVVGEYCGGVFVNDAWLAKGDEKDAVRKPRAWNRLRIVARGPHLVVDLNGVNVVDVTDPKPDPRLLKPGPLALQTYGAEGHAGWVMFRNVRVRRL
jgi:hypothetical protein